MSEKPMIGASRKKRNLFVIVSAVVAGLLVVLLANAHLVYVAVTSQSDCVDHIQTGVTPAPEGSFSAASSSC
jgi:hypothetical protein